MNLLLLLLLPFLTALFLLSAKNHKESRSMAVVGSTLQLLAVIYLLIQYSISASAMPNTALYFEQNFSWFPSLGISFHFGIDRMSIAMLLLTAIVVLAGVLVSFSMELMHKEFYFLLTLLSLGAHGFFISLDLFSLFFFLELAVIPKFLLIGIWGSGQKEKSAMKLALMLMAGSALIAIGMFGLYYFSGTVGNRTFDLPMLAQQHLPKEVQYYFFPFLFVGFGVFTALFPFHTWVPDGHSSAPTAASMFLAGISMKLGAYGCLRVATYLMPDAALFYSPIIIGLATMAIIYGAFATLMQTDLKYINAYSSISHCGFIILGIGMLNKTAIAGSVMQMISHGLMTALFFAVIGMLYQRTHTRVVAQLGGLLKVMPFISVMFVLAGLCSLGLPGLSGFVSEMTIFVGAWQHPNVWFKVATILACASIVVTAVYILRATGSSIMGPMHQQNYASLTDAHWNEKIAAIVLLAAIVVIGVAPFLLTNLLDNSTHILMEKIINSLAL